MVPRPESIERWDCTACGAKRYVPRLGGVEHRVPKCPGTFVKRTFVALEDDAEKQEAA